MKYYYWDLEQRSSVAAVASVHGNLSVSIHAGLSVFIIVCGTFNRFRLVPNVPNQTIFHAPDAGRSLYFVTASLRS
jgi:hypothetical protein